MPFTSVNVIMGDTATSVNQGGASGSTGIQDGGKQMRMAAAEARRVLVEMAAAKLGVPADKLTVTDGVVSDGSKQDQLWGADRRTLFQRRARLEQGDRQRAVRARQGQAEGPQGVQDRRPTAQARGRRPQGLLPAGLRQRRQGARHGAWPRDPSAGRGRHPGEGGRELGQGHPGRQGRAEKDFLGIVADKEWDAIKAAQASRSNGRRRSRRSSTMPAPSTITSARRPYASAKSRNKTAMWTKPSRPPRG